MNARIILVASITLWGLLWSPAHPPALAMDPDGCLTCHQYPGMVTSEDHAGIKLLHIDEDRYLQSAHGKLSCKQCHTVIEKVPHTGDTRVECTTQCHLSDAEKRKVSEVALDEFHRGEQSAIVRLDDPTSCRVCHPLYPHRQNNMVRGLLNLHTGFMVCSVCHLKREKFPDIYYDWNGTETADFIGEPFGTFYNPKLKRASKSQHFLSRISVYTRDQGERKSLMNTWDTAAAHEFKSRQKDLSPVAQKERQAFFHRDISRKEISVACDECHSKDGILDFKALGFDEHTSSNLVNLNIKGLVTHYKTFYFPQLFEK